MALQALPLVPPNDATSWRLLAERINQLIAVLEAYTLRINAPEGQVATFYINGNGAADGEGLLLQLNSSDNARLKNLANGKLILGANNGEQFVINADGTFSLTVASLGNYANDAAAAAGGVPVATLYRNGSVVMIRVA